MADEEKYEYDYDDEEEDYYYESGDEEYEYEDADDYGELKEDMPEAMPALKRAASYTVMDEESLKERQDAVVLEVSELLALSLDEAGVLLRHFEWNSRKLQNRWFEDSDAVRRKAGLLLPPSGSSSTTEKEFTCPTCYDDYPVGEGGALGCEHRFCKECWQAYLDNSIAGGPDCVYVTCPMHKCVQVVPPAFMRKWASAARVRDKYNKYVLRSFVDSNKYVKWCPSPGCGRAVEYAAGGVRDILCSCGYSFCFGCNAEAHRPASCEQLSMWEEKNSSESENVTWIQAHTKRCPECKSPIEKNQGCNHMTCRRAAGGCGHEFCWMCMGPWSEHGSATGGYYTCNKYEQFKSKGKLDELDSMAAMRRDARSELERYTFYYERYLNHRNSQKFAQKTYRDIEAKMSLLQSAKGYKMSEVLFLREGADQVIACRRILMWSYVFSYYLEDGPEKNLFDFLQEMLEKNTEHLHEMVEAPLERFLDHDGLGKVEFFAHRQQVTNFTSVTGKFLSNLLEGVENGLTTDVPVAMDVEAEEESLVVPVSSEDADRDLALALARSAEEM